jgi:hypothetical protein
MAEDQKKTAEKSPKSDWVKPQVSLVEAGRAEFTPNSGGDSYYNYS